MDYKLACEYLLKSYGARNKKGFDVMLDVLDILGNPQKKLKVIHVAGTNGKGSSCMYLSNILRCAGNKVGTFVSPHLIKYNERFLIDNVPISDDELARQVNIVKNATDIVLKDNEIMSFFEIFTIVCFNYFYEKGVDLAVIETGLGGRCDSTNIIENPLLSVITSISYDHMNILGEEIEQIASEKAGIIKKNRPSVLYCNQKLVYNTIKDRSKNLASDLHYLHDFDIKIIRKNLLGTMYSAEIGSFSYKDVFIKLLGDYQIYNSANVIFTAEVLKSSCGLNIPQDAIYSGLAETRLNGRMEVVCHEPLVILDGAHNADAAKELVNACSGYFVNKRIYLLMGVMSDKEYGMMAAELSKIATIAVYTKPDSVRAADPQDIMRYNSSLEAAYTESDCVRAFEMTLEMAGRDDVIIVAGSLYLVGTIKKYLNDKRKYE